MLAAVEHRDLVAGLRELPHDRWSDEDRAADDEDAHQRYFENQRTVSTAARVRFAVFVKP